MWVDHGERSKYLEELGKLKSVKNVKTKLIHADGSIRDCRLSGVVVGINGKQYVLTMGKEIPS